MMDALIIFGFGAVFIPLLVMWGNKIDKAKK